MITKNELLDFINRLCNEEVYEPEEGYWTFRSGGSCGVCIDSAIKVVQEFGGRVMGYYGNRNIEAQIGKFDGHDFALVSERFIVDYLAFRFEEIIDCPVFDLMNPIDRTLVLKLYGSNWDEVPLPIHQASRTSLGGSV